ncbi:MAG: amidohydrolase family protein, partial [Olegusella sp.]|nr:amidohydrolase family protein [Olegusella sp.]
AEAVRNVVEWGLVTTEQAIRMATENPAVSNHIDNVCGYILPGRVADLTVFDNDLAVTATYVGGSPVA